MKYEHKGTTITFDPATGKFTATVGGKHVRAASLDAMKKRIDDAAVAAFQPVECYLEQTGYRAKSVLQFGEVAATFGTEGDDNFRVLAKAQVTGILSSRRTRFNSGKDQWEIAGKGIHPTTERYYRPAAQETIDAWRAYWAAFDAERARHEAANEAVGALKVAIPATMCGE